MVALPAQRARAILQQLAGAEIAVVGDVMLDRYFWGSVSRISPEAPVPVVDVDTESFHLGGAANVAANLLGLGVTPLLCGVVGNDGSGSQLRALCEEQGMVADGIVTQADRPTTVKTRVIGNNQQLVRLDRETRDHVPAAIGAEISAILRSRSKLGAIILEDYDKGLLSPRLITSVMMVAKELNIPVFVDPKRRHFFDFTECTLFKPNRKEAADALQVALQTEADVLKAGRDLLAQLRCDNVLITLGAEGMMLFERDGTVSSVPTRAKRIADVSGAGDTVIATLAAMVAGGASVREAASASNIAAGIVVEEPGIVSVSAARLIEEIEAEERLEKEA